MGNLTRCIGSHDYDMGKDGFDAYVRTTFRTLYSKVRFSRTRSRMSRGILLVGCAGKPTNEIRPFLFSSINEESKAETDLLC